LKFPRDGSGLDSSYLPRQEESNALEGVDGI
jgi:hypothetical protein